MKTTIPTQVNMEVKIYHWEGETSLQPGVDLQKWVDNLTKSWLSHQDMKEGVPQYVKVPEGVALHWLSPVDLDWDYVLKVIPSYSSPEKITLLQKAFKALD